LLLSVEIVALVGEGATIGGAPIAWTAAVFSPYRAVASVAEPFKTTAGATLPSAALLHLALTASASFGSLAFATYFLRTWNPRGEPLQQREAKEDAVADPTAAVGAGWLDVLRPRPKFRPIWPNPILWREVMTRAYGARTVLVKLGYLLVFAILLWWIFTLEVPTDAARLRLEAARAVLPLAILSLLLVNAQSVTAVTSERDLKSLDLLLVTDVTPREFVFGKIAGILFNTKEMLIAPILLLAACGFRGFVGPSGFFFTTSGFFVFVAFASILGIHAGLRYESTRVALANSLGTMFLLFVGVLICLFLILVSGKRFEAQWASFILFVVLGSIGLWISLSANHPSNAITLTAAVTPFATLYCLIAFLVGDRSSAVLVFLVGTSVYGFAVASLLVPMLSEFDVATGRTSFDEG
ncbi:MAG: hypothetical protein ACRDD1_11065, partial [Planctomycetia bacterium]